MDSRPSPTTVHSAARAEGLTKTYGAGDTRVTALDDVTVDFTAGEFTAIMGPSGSGKSTLMHCMAGLDSPTSGSAFLGDTDISGLGDKALTTLRRDRLGFIFQSFNLVPTLTAAENITLPIDIAGDNVDKEWFGEITSRLGLTDRLGHRPSELSGGQQQRVALARAVVISPSVLLLDEPLSNLDAKLREETRGQIRRVQTESGITALYVTHDQAEAMAMSDRIAVLDAGRVHQIASPDTIYHRPRTEFVARFIGRSNVMPATVTAVGDATVDVTVGEVAVTAPRPDIDVTVGDSVGLSLRPETLGFVADGEGLFRGEVTESEFSGATSTFTVEVGESTMLVTVPATGTRPDVGDRVSVGLVSGGAWVVER